MARSEWEQAQGGQTSDHAHGEQHREDALVALQQAEEDSQGLAFGGGYWRCDDCHSR